MIKKKFKIISFANTKPPKIFITSSLINPLIDDEFLPNFFFLIPGHTLQFRSATSVRQDLLPVKRVCVVFLGTVGKRFVRQTNAAEKKKKIVSSLKSSQTHTQRVKDSCTLYVCMFICALLCGFIHIIQCYSFINIVRVDADNRRPPHIIYTNRSDYNIHTHTHAHKYNILF